MNCAPKVRLEITPAVNILTRVTAVLLPLVVFWSGMPKARAASFVASGFQLDQLVALSGSGADPGISNPSDRLKWATEVAIPGEWRSALPVQWEIGDTGRGHLALSYIGRVVVASRLLIGPPELVLATVAHEMGHQIAYYFVPPGDGSPPRGFSDVRGRGYVDLREAWADCVSRVWTGTVLRTTSEAEPCPVITAEWVAEKLQSPEHLRADARGEGRAYSEGRTENVPPKVIPPPVAIPPLAPVVPEPIQPSASPAYEQPSPRPVPTPRPARGKEQGWPVAVVLPVLLLCPVVAGFVTVASLRRRFGPVLTPRRPGMKGSLRE